MNLVLGAIKGLEIESIAPFLFSLQQSGFEGQVAFYSAQTSERTRVMLERSNVILITAEEPEDLPAQINSLRYFVYEAYLQQNGRNFTNIMLADVRDMVFQRDPFALDLQDSVCCSLEDKTMTIGTCTINADWIRRAFGGSTLEAMRDRHISCSGATIGPAAEMQQYVSAMTSALRDLHYRDPGILWNYPGIDQAVHNHLLFNGALPRTRLLANEEGHILTLSHVDPESLRFDGEDQILDGSGDVVHVIHQYDRYPEQANRVLNHIDRVTLRARAARQSEAVQRGSHTGAPQQ